jgi:hypothetical protein
MSVSDQHGGFRAGDFDAFTAVVTLTALAPRQRGALALPSRHPASLRLAGASLASGGPRMRVPIRARAIACGLIGIPCLECKRFCFCRLWQDKARDMVIIGLLMRKNAYRKEVDLGVTRVLA